MGMKFANNATTVLASGINSSVTSLTVTTGQGALFPSLSGGDYFYCTLANVVGTVEIVKVTARSTDTFTIVRAQDNTLAASWLAGDKVELRLVAASLNDFPKSDETNTFSARQTDSVDALISGLTVGKGAGSVSTNTAVGASALAANTTGGYNVAVGYLAMAANTTGEDNVAVGRIALDANTTGGNNIALGDAALTDNTTGSNNVAVGRQALTANSTASNNTAVGYQAGYSNTTGIDNTTLGMNTLRTNTVGSQNTAVGKNALYTGTGTYNTAIGFNAGSDITTGSKNTILGAYGGNQGGLDIRTASNYIVLSDGDGNPRGIFNSTGGLWVGNTTRQSTSNSSFIQTTINDWTANFQCNTSTSSQNLGVLINYSGSAPNGTGQQFLLCQDTGTRAEIRSNGGLANYSANNANLSDARTKTDIVDAGNYLAKICAIPVRTFKYKDQTDDLLNLGVIAQEVETIAPELVDVSGFGETPEDGIPLKAIYQTDLQYALMKAIQELKAEFDAYKATHP